MTDLITIKDLKVEFNIHDGVLRALDGVSFRVRAGCTTALVGESGSGKSVCSQAIMGILPKIARIAGGEILYQDPENDGAPIDLAQLDPDTYNAAAALQDNILFGKLAYGQAEGQ
jgi:peptide/nickel transport system ATP-binding protein